MRLPISSLRLLLAAGLGAAAIAPLPSAQPPASPSAPVPPSPAAPAPTPAVSGALRSATTIAHARWKAEDGGGAYRPSLAYLRGTPALMLITTAGEPAPRTLHRKRAIVQACGFLLDEAAFARAVICIVETDPRRPEQPRVRNHVVHRPTFHAAARAAAGIADAKQAVRRARDVPAHSLRICADLGID